MHQMLPFEFIEFSDYNNGIIYKLLYSYITALFIVYHQKKSNSSKFARAVTGKLFLQRAR